MAGKIKKRVPDIPVHKIPMKERIKKDLKRNYLLYLMLLPGIFILICFKVGPVGAMVIAFQDFSAFKDIPGSIYAETDKEYGCTCDFIYCSRISFPHYFFSVFK